MAVPPLHPIVVVPLVPVLPGKGCCSRPQLTKVAVRISLEGFDAIKAGNVVFIQGSVGYMWNKPFPDPGFIQPHFQYMQLPLPSVEFSHNRNYCCVWGPD